MYRDRQEAGAVLADLLVREHPARVDMRTPPVVVGLPRGGVPVAAVVARILGAPLEVFVAKKIGIPGHDELGVGAVAEGGVVVIDEELLRRCGLDAADLHAAIATKAHEVTARAARFRGGRPAPDWRGRTVVVVDDGVANGVTAAAALRAAEEDWRRRVEDAPALLVDDQRVRTAIEECEDSFAAAKKSRLLDRGVPVPHLEVDVDVGVGEKELDAGIGTGSKKGKSSNG
jgi:predicted phosphoribosyltransferase